MLCAAHFHYDKLIAQFKANAASRQPRPDSISRIVDRATAALRFPFPQAQIGSGRPRRRRWTSLRAPRWAVRRCAVIITARPRWSAVISSAMHPSHPGVSDPTKTCDDDIVDFDMQDT